MQTSLKCWQGFHYPMCGLGTQDLLAESFHWYSLECLALFSMISWHLKSSRWGSESMATECNYMYIPFRSYKISFNPFIRYPSINTIKCAKLCFLASKYREMGDVVSISASEIHAQIYYCTNLLNNWRNQFGIMFTTMLKGQWTLK